MRRQLAAVLRWPARDRDQARGQAQGQRQGQGRRRRARRRATARRLALVAGVAWVAGVAGVVVAGPDSVAAAGTASGAGKALVGPTPPRAATYYVAVGASESVGFQPVLGHGRHGHGQRTSSGYANDLTAIERARWAGLRLRAFGCPGITAQAALRGGGACHYAAGSQVRAAVDFIRRHRAATVLATVDLGFNDLWPCLRRDTVHRACVARAMREVAQVLPEILRHLQAAGGPRLHVVGVLHNDPYLGDYLAGRRGKAFALASIAAIGDLNRTLATAYARADVLAANVPAAFATEDHRLVDLRGHGWVPSDVARMCAMSWMCRPPPYGENIHPNAVGYRAIADALAAALATTRGRLAAPSGHQSLPALTTAT